MPSLPEEFWHFATTNEQFIRQHQLLTIAREDLRRFLFSSMDEVRLWYASINIKAILQEIDLDDADHFRQGLLRREITGDMAYPKQRDHSAHTLNNYLLGWYVFAGSPLIKTAFEKQFAARGIDEAERGFRGAWPIASVLHDIGYLFEGSLLPLSTALQSRQVTIGAEVARDYFSHRFWIDAGFDSIEARGRIRDLAEVSEPDFSTTSLGAIADSLRSLGSLKALRAAVRDDRPENWKIESAGDFVPDRLPADAFDLWQAHYKHFGFPGMAQRIADLRTTFESLMRDGLGFSGLRVLDHGVCGGLLLLLFSTFYFRMHFGLAAKKAPDDEDALVIDRFCRPTRLSTNEYEASWWWSGMTWATAATALHNIQQQPSIPAVKKTPLGVDEDVLAYLGILVDCVQEWDRYTVGRESVVGGVLPLQGIDMRLETIGGKIVIALEDQIRKAAMTKSLDGAVSDWRAVIEIV